MRLSKLLASVAFTAVFIASASAETLKIGVIAPLTGGGAPWGLVTAEAPRILADEVNAQGGLEVGGKKYQVQVIAYDDQYKAADAVAAYNRLVNQDGVKFLIIMSSPATMALKQSVEDDKVVALTSAATSKAIDANSRYMFRLYSTPADYVPAFVGWLKDNVKERRVAIVNPNDETGWDGTAFDAKVFAEHGFEIVARELFERSVKDFQPLLTKIIGLKPELVDLGTTSPATAGLIVRQARELGYKGLFVKTSGPSPREIVAASGKEAAEGMINLLYADPAKPGYQRLAAAYKRSVTGEPNEMIVTFYDAASVLLRAIQRAGDPNDTAKVAAGFAQALPMESVQGDTLTLGGKSISGVDQQIMTVDYIGVIRDGEPVIVGAAR